MLVVLAALVGFVVGYALRHAIGRAREADAYLEGAIDVGTCLGAIDRREFDSRNRRQNAPWN